MAKTTSRKFNRNKKAYKPEGSLFSDSKKNMKKYETWKF